MLCIQVWGRGSGLMVGCGSASVHLRHAPNLFCSFQLAICRLCSIFYTRKKYVCRTINISTITNNLWTIWDVTLYLTIDCDHVLVLVWLGDNNARWSLETAAAALALNYFHITTQDRTRELSDGKSFTLGLQLRYLKQPRSQTGSYKTIMKI